MSPNMEHTIVCLPRHGLSQRTTVKVVISPKALPCASADLQNGARAVKKPASASPGSRGRHRWGHLTTSLGSSRLGWAIADFVAGVICGTYGGFLGHPAFLFTKGFSALVENGILFAYRWFCSHSI